MYHDLYRYHDIEAPVGVMLFCSIRAYIAATKVKTVLQPVHLDASEPYEKWAGLPRGACDVIVASTASVQLFPNCRGRPYTSDHPMIIIIRLIFCCEVL